MSILNCSTRVTIINCTGLPATFKITPSEQHMRLQPIGNANVSASVDTNASSLVDWMKEWLHLISYGPTYKQLEWTIDAGAEETVRFEVQKPVKVDMKWSDPSVSWENHESGIWSIDVCKGIEVTVYLRAEIGEYQYKKTIANIGRPAQVKSVQLKPFLEIACDDEIPFIIERQPVATMFWSAQINLEQIVNPTKQ